MPRGKLRKSLVDRREIKIKSVLRMKKKKCLVVMSKFARIIFFPKSWPNFFSSFLVLYPDFFLSLSLLNCSPRKTVLHFNDTSIIPLDLNRCDDSNQLRSTFFTLDPCFFPPYLGKSWIRSGSNPHSPDWEFLLLLFGSPPKLVRLSSVRRMLLAPWRTVSSILA